MSSLRRKITKSSIQIIADGASSMLSLRRTVKELSGVYELKVVEDSFFVAAEFYLELNLAPQERAAQRREVMDAVDRNMKMSNVQRSA